MKFDKAMELSLKGKRVARKDWVEKCAYHYIYAIGNELFDNEHLVFDVGIWKESEICNEWVIYKEPTEIREVL